jgi:inner membrane protein
VEPITHALASLAVAKAAPKRLPRFGAAMLVAAGVAPDLDFASYFAGAGRLLALHRVLLHSIPGGLATACAVAIGFCALNRRRPPKDPSRNLRFPLAFATSIVGVLLHDALDLASGVGVNLLWPLRNHWYGLPLTTNLDPWILAILCAGILLPMLFGLVSEEIGERKKGPRGRIGALVALFALAGYFSFRADLHSRALDLLLSREYHGRSPLAAGAFPSSSNPFAWRGVVSTENTLEELDVSLAPGAEFDPDRSLTRYKPESSPELAAALKTRAAAQFLAYAQFPLAGVARREDGFWVEMSDLRFAPRDTSPENIILRIDLDANFMVRSEAFRFAASPGQ